MNSRASFGRSPIPLVARFSRTYERASLRPGNRWTLQDQRTLDLAALDRSQIRWTGHRASRSQSHLLLARRGTFGGLRRQLLVGRLPRAGCSAATPRSTDNRTVSLMMAILCPCPAIFRRLSACVAPDTPESRGAAFRDWVGAGTVAGMWLGALYGFVVGSISAYSPVLGIVGAIGLGGAFGTLFGASVGTISGLVVGIANGLSHQRSVRLEQGCWSASWRARS